MTESVRPLPLSARSLVFSSSFTWDEFLATDQTYAKLVSKRRHEVHFSADEQAFFCAYPDSLRLLVIVTADDPDTIAVLPILAAIADACARFDLRIVRDDQDLTTLDNAVEEIDLLNDLDDLDFPLLLIFDEEWQYQEQWGPRPQSADRYLDDWLGQHSDYEALADDESEDGQDRFLQLLDQLVYEMRLWYNSGLTSETIVEIRTLLNSLLSVENGDGNSDRSEGPG